MISLSKRGERNKSRLHHSGLAVTQVLQVICIDAVPMWMWSRKPVWDVVFPFSLPHSHSVSIHPSPAAAVCRVWCHRRTAHCFAQFTGLPSLTRLQSHGTECNLQKTNKQADNSMGLLIVMCLKKMEMMRWSELSKSVVS